MGKRWGKVDFAELKALEQRIDKLEKTDFDRLCRELANELAARLLAKVKKRTPVGVVPKDLYDNKKTTVTATGASGKKREFLRREDGSFLPPERRWAESHKQVRHGQAPRHPWE